MNRDKKAEAQILGQPVTDRLTAKFYLHDVKNMDTPETREAMRKADAKAARRSELSGKLHEPDYTPENLKKLGAKEEVIKVPYVEIKRMGAKDFKSSKVTDEHKQEWPELWSQFKADNYEYFQSENRGRNEVLQSSTGGQQDTAQGGNYQGGVCYTPTRYTITFG